MRHGRDFKEFWNDYLQSQARNILLVGGLGFDPRSYHGYKTLLSYGGAGKRDCLLVNFDEGAESASKSYGSLIEENVLEIKKLSEGNQLVNKQIPMKSADGRRTGSRSASNVVSNLAELEGYDEVIIDVSAMPRSIYFPLIGQVLYLLDFAVEREEIVKPPNLHVLVSENAELDRKINDDGIAEEATYMRRFTGSLNSESAADIPRVWIPLLGEKQILQLERIYEAVKPDEVSPILPSPSINPRRVDDLLLEYRKFLFDTVGVESGNFVYVSEQNPFEVYRAILDTVQHYNDALKTLGGCQVVISALSSKLLSLGALLAAYELKNSDFAVGISHVEASGYTIEGSVNRVAELGRTELFSLWLSGDCYE